MKPDFKKCCIFLALLAAAAVLIVLFIKWNEADVSITIGFPVEAGAVDYTNSKPISDRRTVNRILFALLTGKALADSAVPNVPPDAVIDDTAQRRKYWIPVLHMAGSDQRDLRNGDRR